MPEYFHGRVRYRLMESDFEVFLKINTKQGRVFFVRFVYSSVVWNSGFCFNVLIYSKNNFAKVCWGKELSAVCCITCLYLLITCMYDGQSQVLQHCSNTSVADMSTICLSLPKKLTISTLCVFLLIVFMFVFFIKSAFDTKKTRRWNTKKYC